MGNPINTHYDTTPWIAPFQARTFETWLAGALRCMHNACSSMMDVPKNIQIRNVPDDVHRVLTERAAAVGQSLQEYLLGRLKADVATKDNREILEEARRAIREYPEDFTTVDVVGIIREDRESH